MMRIQHYLFFILMMAAFACEKNSKTGDQTSHRKMIPVPEFNADSAYAFVRAQVDFGPRVPNSVAHQKTGDYLISQLKSFGAVTVVQEFTATTFDNHKLTLRNIIASINPENKKRILLAAHWDTRPFADKDTEMPNAQPDGANDGASGVAVLLEVARVIMQQQPPTVGVDFILFDGEDWGERHGEAGTHPVPPGLKEWWCLGSQHWSTHKHKPNYSAYFGILLDMVGGKNAMFAKDAYSLEYAPNVVDKVWKTAAQSGFSHLFIQEQTGFITDDHQFVNEVGKIPMVDIVSYDPLTGFGDFHHTRKDNMEVISKETLYAVGKTVLTVVYSE